MSTEDFSIVNAPSVEEEIAAGPPSSHHEVGTEQLNKKLWKINSGLLVELSNEREEKRKLVAENAALKEEVGQLKELLSANGEFKSASVPVQTEQLVTPMSVIDEVIEKFGALHREAQSHLSDGWDSEVTLDSNVCDLVQHSLLELSRCKSAMINLNDALIKTAAKSMAMSHSQTEPTESHSEKEFSTIAVNTDEEKGLLSSCGSYTSVASNPHEELPTDLIESVVPSAPPADSVMGFEWTSSTVVGSQSSVRPLVETPIVSVEPPVIPSVEETHEGPEMDIIQQLQLDDFDKRVCPVCQAEYSPQLQAEFEGHVENHFVQQQDDAMATAAEVTLVEQISSDRECPFCSLFFTQRQQEIFEKHVYSHMGFYPPQSA